MLLVLVFSDVFLHPLEHLDLCLQVFDIQNECSDGYCFVVAPQEAVGVFVCLF